MTEPSWTISSADRQIVSGPYYVAPTLGVDRAASWVDGGILGGLSENLTSWLGTLLNGLSGSRPRRNVTVTIGDGQTMPREAVAIDSWRRDSVLKGCPTLNASPVLNRNPVEEARLDAEHDARMAEVDRLLQGSILGKILDNYIDGDVFIAPTPPIKSPTGTIFDGIIKVIP